MAFPTITATNTTDGTTATTSPVVNLPATVNAGETLLVFFRTDTVGAITFPGGWTELFDLGTNQQTTAAWKLADGTEGGTTITLTTAGGKFAALSWSIAAADPSTTPPESSAGASGFDANPDPDTVTPTGGADDYLWLALMGIEGEQAMPPTYPTNYTENQIHANSGTAGAVSTNVRVAAAKRTNLNAASENPGVYTVNVTDDWRAFTFAVHPAGAPPPSTNVGWYGAGWF